MEQAETYASCRKGMGGTADFLPCEYFFKSNQLPGTGSHKYWRIRMISGDDEHPQQSKRVPSKQPDKLNDSQVSTSTVSIPEQITQFAATIRQLVQVVRPQDPTRDTVRFKNSQKQSEVNQAVEGSVTRPTVFASGHFINHDARRRDRCRWLAGHRICRDVASRISRTHGSERLVETCRREKLQPKRPSQSAQGPSSNSSNRTRPSAVDCRRVLMAVAGTPPVAFVAVGRSLRGR
jgi:hypothetical protein